MLLIGTDSGVYTYDVEDGQGEPSGCVLEGAVSAIIPDQARAGGLIASVHDRGLFRSDDGGKSWTPLIGEIDPWSIVSAPAGILYAGVRPAGMVRSRSGGEEWEEVPAVRGLSAQQTWTFPSPSHIPNIRSLTVSPRDPETVYAAVEVGGVIRSFDGGDTWEELREGLHLDVHTLICTAGAQDTLYAATGRGFFRSLDAGDTWESRCQGLGSIYLVPLAVHPQDSQTIFSAASQGRPRYWRRDEGAKATIYRSRDGGLNWASVMDGLPSTLTGMVFVLATDPQEPDTVYAGTGDGQVLVSRTLGDSWSVLAEGLPPVKALAAV